MRVYDQWYFCLPWKSKKLKMFTILVLTKRPLWFLWIFDIFQAGYIKKTRTFIMKMLSKCNTKIIIFTNLSILKSCLLPACERTAGLGIENNHWWESLVNSVSLMGKFGHLCFIDGKIWSILKKWIWESLNLGCFGPRKWKLKWGKQVLHW